MAGQTGYQEIARRYARAFFQLAREQGALDRVSSDLQALKRMLAESDDFQRFISNAALKRAQEAEVIGVLADKAGLSPLTKKFLGTLAMNRRLDLLPLIVTAAENEIARHKGEITAEVTSAEPLDAVQISSIAAGLRKVLGLTVKVELKQDADIMGGLIIKVGSQRIDSSVRSKLERLHRAIKNPETSTDNQKKMREVA